MHFGLIAVVSIALSAFLPPAARAQSSITLNPEQVAGTSPIKSKTQFTGRIIDENGDPLVGAGVFIEGTTTGVVTNFEGYFIFDEVNFPVTIVVTYIGYESKTLTLTGHEAMPLLISLTPSENVLEETVVVGYGSIKKVNLTGAVSAVTERELRDRPVSNVGMALQGLVPNLNVTQSSGQPGAGSSYNIRGNTSPNGGDPLVLVDGVETYLDRINSNDIESISVLKDASSAAIYGARAAYGVILVTTKSGKYDQAPKVTADIRFSMSANTVCTDFETRGYYSAKIADTFYAASQGVNYTSYTDTDYQRMWERRNDKTENPDRPWVITEMRNGKLSYVYLANFDWYNYMYDESRPTQDYNINVSGGSKNATYMVSARYYNQRGINRIRPDYYDSYNARAKMSIKIRPWLTLGNNTKFFHGKYSYYGYDGDYNNFRKPTLHALASLVPVNPDGTAVSHTAMTNSSTHYLMDGYNAMLQKGTAKGYDSTTEVTTTFDLSVNILPELQFKADFSYKFGYLRNVYRSTTVEYSQYPGEVLTESTSSFDDSLTETVWEQNNYTANGYFVYENTWNGGHHFTATTGINYESRHYKDLVVTRQDLLSETLSDFNLATGDVTELTGGISEYALLGVFYRFAYDYKSKYLVEFNGRYDGSSRFPKGKQWGFFPSFSGAWRPSEESFWAPISGVWNNFKIRLSYGSLGNQQIGYYDFYQSVSTEGTMSYSFDGSTLSSYATVDDPVSSGTWETVTSMNLGFDFGLWSDRLTFNADFYIRDTKGILTEGKQLPSIYGASEPTVNANDLRAKGYELQLTWKDSFMLFKRRFGYSVGASLADYTAEYTSCDNPSGLFSDPYVGKKLGEIWGFRIGGLFQNDAEAQLYSQLVDMSAVCADYYSSTGTYGSGVYGGDMKYLDLDGDGVISFGQSTLDDPGDREVIGNSQPRYSYSFNFAFDYYGFDFSIFFQGIGHMDWYPGSDNLRFWGPYSRPYASFVARDFMSDVWTESNTDAYFPRARGYASLNSGNSLYYTNDRYLQNLAYLRLKNLTVGYTLPTKVANKIGLSYLRVYFSGENLWTWSAVHSKYIDPEQISSDSDKKGNVYYWYKTFSVGLSVEF